MYLTHEAIKANVAPGPEVNPVPSVASKVAEVTHWLRLSASQVHKEYYQGLQLGIIV